MTPVRRSTSGLEPIPAGALLRPTMPSLRPACSAKPRSTGSEPASRGFGLRLPVSLRPPRARDGLCWDRLFGLALLCAALSTCPASGDDRQPAPPRIFFPEPDTVASEEIAALLQNSFADVNKAPAAREALVRRFGLWSVRPLLDRIEKDGNVTVAWNAILAVGSLRRISLTP